VTDAAEPHPGLARAAESGIHRIPVPTPFAVGRVNCYLVEDDPLTLVDAGPNSGTSLDVLEQGVRDLGHRLEDIELVVVTHHHLDHIGLVGLVAGRAGAEVAALDHALPYLSDYRAEMDAEDDFASATMVRYGVPADVVEALRSVSRAFRGWGAGARVDRVLRAGDVVELRDRSWRVHWRPGHSISDTLLEDAERRTAIVGDHLLAHISSNPLLSPPRDGGERPRMLMTYLDSLAATRAMDLELALPGHGDPIADHPRLIDDRFAMHRRRADKLHRLIAERPRTAYELAQSLWGNIAVTQAFLTISEIVGHTDLLVADGKVREVADGDVVRFEAATEPAEQ